MDVVTDFPERMKRGVKVFVGAGHAPSIISMCRPHAQGLLIQFRGVDSAEKAGEYRNQEVYVLTADRPRLPPGQYYHHELLGSLVLDEDRGALGKLTDILQTGANDVYVVRGPSGSELLLPAIRGVVLEIDSRRRLIRVRIPEGMDWSAGAGNSG
jgi:16S rRNA processing protein RimM